MQVVEGGSRPFQAVQPDSLKRIAVREGRKREKILTYAGLHQYAENLYHHAFSYFPQSETIHFLTHKRRREITKDSHWSCLWSAHVCVHTHTDKCSLSQQKLNSTLLESGIGKFLCILKGHQKSLQLAEQVFWNGLARTHTLILSTTEESQLPLRPRTKTALGWVGERCDDS